MKPLPNIQAILIFVISIAIISCNARIKNSEPVWSDLPGVGSLDSLKQTDFVATLENPIAENRNIIYASAFLYAWDKVKEELEFPIVIDSANSADFKLLNQSIAPQNSLTETEYSVTAEKVDHNIIVKAFFNKTLPFEVKLQVSGDPILFGTARVSAFGMYEHNDDFIKFTEILYYKDDNHFIIKLAPKDKEHEIILVKGIDKYQTLKDAIMFTNNLIDQGKKEQTNDTLFWKYEIRWEDIFSIPAIKFNIATHYKKLEGQAFSTKDYKEYLFVEAYQRTGLILNENGAVIESKAVEIIAPTSAAPSGEQRNMPAKKMIFDKPFLVIIKRADKTAPYFVMKVANAELLTRK